MPTDKKRLIIPIGNFNINYKQQNNSTKKLEFYNPKDKSTQIIPKEDGFLVCYDFPGLKEEIEQYLNQNPNTFSNFSHLKIFIDFLATKTGDIYNTNIHFLKELINVPSKLEIGKPFSSAKKKELSQAFRVEEGEVFEGELAKPQTAGKNGAYILKDASGLRMIQDEEFNNAYIIITQS